MQYTVNSKQKRLHFLEVKIYLDAENSVSRAEHSEPKAEMSDSKAEKSDLKAEHSESRANKLGFSGKTDWVQSRKS
jgi:hypothetical protein